MIQLAWRFLMFQKDSALAHWFYARTKNAPQTRKTMIVALARKFLIALWRLVREGAIPELPIAPLGFHAGEKNGSAASELRRRCA
jgi:hypothetical protein